MLVGAILAGLSLAMGAAEFGLGAKSSHDQKKAAEEKAKKQREMAYKEFGFNTKQEFKDYRDNLDSNYRNSSRGIFEATKQYQQSLDKANMISSNMRNHNIASSSFSSDAQTQLYNQLQEVTKDILVKQDYANKRLAENYSTNIYQLELNREKMENDISLSVNRANAQANQTLVRGAIDFGQSGLNAYKTYKTWGGGSNAKK